MLLRWLKCPRSCICTFWVCHLVTQLLPVFGSLITDVSNWGHHYQLWHSAVKNRPQLLLNVNETVPLLLRCSRGRPTCAINCYQHLLPVTNDFISEATTWTSESLTTLLVSWWQAMTFVNILPTVQNDTFCMAQYFISVVQCFQCIFCVFREWVWQKEAWLTKWCSISWSWQAFRMP